MVPGISIQMSLWILTEEKRKDEEKNTKGRECKHFHMTQHKQWEGSEVKLFHFLDTVVEVILQGNKEKAIGSENLKYVLLLSFEKETNPFLLMLRSALNRNSPWRMRGKERLQNAEVCLYRGCIRSLLLPRHSALLVSLNASSFPKAVPASPLLLFPKHWHQKQTQLSS